MAIALFFTPKSLLSKIPNLKQEMHDKSRIPTLTLIFIIQRCRFKFIFILLFSFREGGVLGGGEGCTNTFCFK